MKAKEGIYKPMSEFPTNIYDSGNVRKLLGLPDLHDTDRNCVRMHNLSIESETQFINKKMGMTRNYGPSFSSKAETGLESQFGF
jgi:hypothetical protein